MILLSGIRSEGFVFIEEGGHYWEARISYNNCFSDGELVLLRTSLVFFKIPTCLYNSTMHSARFLFLYYNSPINLCMILLAILHQLVHIQSIWYHILWVWITRNVRQLVGRVWYHKLGLNWTNHDRMPALRSLCCVFVLAKYRGISKTLVVRRKLRKVFKESKLCREKRYKAQSTL